MTETPKPGKYNGISFEEYRSWEAINWHTLWRLLEESPAHANYELENGTNETEALAFGSLTDFVLLEPARFKEQTAIQPEIGEGKAPKRPTRRQIEAKNPSDESTKAIRFWAEWDTENAGKIVVTAEDYNKVLQISDRVRTAQCRELIVSGMSQVCLVWVDPVTGLLCKARLDYERHVGFNHYITDLKTARSAKMGVWKWATRKYGYRGQMAFYHDGWLEVEHETSLCWWLVAEKHGAFVVKPWMASDSMLAIGRKQYREALNKWAECVKANDWPDYGGPEEIEPDDWELQAYLVGKYQAKPEPLEHVQYTAGPAPEEPDEIDEFLK